MLFRSRGTPDPSTVLEINYSEATRPNPSTPELLNSFGFWNLVILGLMIANFGYPIAQFFIHKTLGSSAWGF